MTERKYPYGETLSKCDSVAFVTALALVIRTKPEEDKSGKDNKHLNAKS